MTIARRSASNIRPYRPEPPLHFLLRQHGEGLLDRRDRSVGGRFAEKQNVLDVVLDHGVWLIRLAIEASTVAGRLRDAVSDFVPKDSRDAVEAKPARPNHDVGVQGEYLMATAPAGNADVADHAADSAAFHEHAEAMSPDLIELIEERLVVGNVAELACSVFVFF